MKTSNVRGYRVVAVVVGLLFTMTGSGSPGSKAMPRSSSPSEAFQNGAGSLYRQSASFPFHATGPGEAPGAVRKMRLSCATVHVTADKTTGAFTVKCEVESNEVAARTEFVKVTPVANVQDLAVDFPQVQPQKGSPVEVEASGKLPPGVDSGVFILSICNADGVEEDRVNIRVHRA